MHILWSCLAYSTRPYFTLWEAFRHQKSSTIRLGMPRLPTRSGYPWHLYKHSWRNSENWSKKTWSRHWSYAFLTIIPLFQHSIIPCRRHKTSVVKRCMISIYYRNSRALNYGKQKVVLKLWAPNEFFSRKILPLYVSQACPWRIFSESTSGKDSPFFTPKQICTSIPNFLKKW